jgi:hypothetical protein
MREHDLCAVHVRLDRADRTVDDELDTHGCGKVVDRVSIVY